jgi:hypothetical protein
VAARPSPQKPVTSGALSDVRVSDLRTVNCTHTCKFEPAHIPAASNFRFWRKVTASTL